MPKPLDYLRSPIRSRHQLVELLKTLVLVLPLTVLIWIYAERAQTTDESNLQVSIDVGIASPTLFASLIEPVGSPILIDVKGSRAKIEDLKNQLQSRIRLPLNPQLAPDSEQTLPTVALLNEYPAIRDSGVTVTSAVPSTIKVRIDSRDERRGVTLRLPDNLPISVASSSIEPATVTVTGPSRVLDRLFPPMQKWSLSVDLSTSMDRISQPGTHKLDGVPISIAREPGVRVQPERASSVRIEVSAREIEYEIPSVPLEVLKPLVSESSLVAKPSNNRNVVTNVRVRGPANLVQKLQSIEGRPPEVTPYAVLRVTAADVGKGEVTREVIIDGLPAGVTLTGNAPSVEFSAELSRSPE